MAEVEESLQIPVLSVPAKTCVNILISRIGSAASWGRFFTLSALLLGVYAELLRLMVPWVRDIYTTRCFSPPRPRFSPSVII
jgi:hypothetical protein